MTAKSVLDVVSVVQTEDAHGPGSVTQRRVRDLVSMMVHIRTHLHWQPDYLLRS